MALQRACLGCGESVPSGSRCDDCKRPRDRSNELSASQRGYDHHYRRLRAKALALQPWCACGATENLTVDHSPKSWELIADGHRPTLAWFADGLLRVSCLRCNIAAGHARGAGVTRTD